MRQQKTKTSSTNKEIFEDMIKRASQPLEELEKKRIGIMAHIVSQFSQVFLTWLLIV